MFLGTTASKRATVLIFTSNVLIYRPHDQFAVTWGYFAGIEVPLGDLMGILETSIHSRSPLESVANLPFCTLYSSFSSFDSEEMDEQHPRNPSVCVG
jgi:hypothetical protein